MTNDIDVMIFFSIIAAGKPLIITWKIDTKLFINFNRNLVRKKENYVILEVFRRKKLIMVRCV